MYTELQLTRAIKHDEEILRDPNTPPQERRTIQQRIRDRRSRLAERQRDRDAKPMSDEEFNSLTLEEYLARHPLGVLKVLLPAGGVPEKFRPQVEALLAADRRRELLAHPGVVQSKCSDPVLQKAFEDEAAEARRVQAEHKKEIEIGKV